MQITSRAIKHDAVKNRKGNYFLKKKLKHFPRRESCQQNNLFFPEFFFVAFSPYTPINILFTLPTTSTFVKYLRSQNKSAGFFKVMFS